MNLVESFIKKVIIEAMKQAHASATRDGLWFNFTRSQSSKLVTW